VEVHLGSYFGTGIGFLQAAEFSLAEFSPVDPFGRGN